MAPIRNSSKLIILAVALLLMASGCKSKKLAMQASNAAREKARLEQEAALRKQKEAELAKQKEDEERARREALNPEPVRIEPKENSPSASLSSYFDAISTAGSVNSANNSIHEALGLFASPETPVLIVISNEDGEKDYDRPTTIQHYLNYLKDQKKNINSITNLKFDAGGKITEVELRKN